MCVLRLSSTSLNIHRAHIVNHAEKQCGAKTSVIPFCFHAKFSAEPSESRASACTVTVLCVLYVTKQNSHRQATEEVKAESKQTGSLDCHKFSMQRYIYDYGDM